MIRVFANIEGTSFNILARLSSERKACCLLIGLFFFILSLSAQDQKFADSLARIYQANTLTDTAKLELLRNLAFNEQRDLHLGLKYADELISLSTQMGNNIYLYRGYLQKGNKNSLLGNLQGALDDYFKCVDVARKANYHKGEGTAYGAIADIYVASKNLPNASLYYKKAISILRQVSDSIALASVISNAGDAFLSNKIYDSALSYFKEAGLIFEKVDYLPGKAINLGNIGMVYANTGQSNLAETNINEGIRILEESGDYYPICVYLISMCDIYLEKGDERTAVNYAKRSLKLAQQYALKPQISDANLKLSELSEKAGKYREAFVYYKNYILYRDSVRNIEAVQNMADLRTDYEVSQKQSELDLQEKTHTIQTQKFIYFATAIAFGLLVTIGAVTLRFFQIRKTKRVIENEKRKSEELLLNILPAEVAEEIKITGSAKAKAYTLVTVMFTDFKDFTSVSERVSAELLVDEIHTCFSAFDRILQNFKIEKIKTIGDAYLCASGLPISNYTHATDMINAAFEIRNYMLQRKQEKETKGEIPFELRIGIHTGPIVAGIVGIKKYAYDIWGDTVNIAARMEQNSEASKINISGSTYELVKGKFDCTHRGKIMAKNKGEIDMYFVEKNGL